MSRCHLNYLCPVRFSYRMMHFVDNGDKNLLHRVKVCKVTRTLFEFHTNRKRGSRRSGRQLRHSLCFQWTRPSKSFATLYKQCKDLHPESSQHSTSPQHYNVCQNNWTMQGSWDCLEKSDNLLGFKLLLSIQHGCSWLTWSFLCGITWRG